MAVSFRTLSVLLVVIASGCRCGGFDVPTLPEKVIGTCSYTNKFSNLPECKEYVGEWSESDATGDCTSNGSTFAAGNRCNIDDDSKYGDCIFIVDEGKSKYARVELPGTTASKCGSMQRGCELFGGGSFVPTAICGGFVSDGGGGGLPTFHWPEQTCREPKAGEGPGASDGGQVCTWSMISGATEEGRDFRDYGDCDAVRTQRPYYGAPTNTGADQADPRMDDSTYVTEQQWVKSQITSAACVCCHSTAAPQGTSNWFVESGPNFLNSFYDRGLAMGAGWIDTVGFGAYPPEQNNGFGRATPANPNHSIFPTTDDARMRAFFEGELAHRGRTRADFADQTMGAGPLDAQRAYQPTACEAGQGIDADGTVRWVGGNARYLYVMHEGTQSPGVPPNLDTPEGTMWRVDLPFTAQTLIEPGTVMYGETPAGALPRVAPTEGLISGQRYYLYVLQDIAIPITRCLFTMP